MNLLNLPHPKLFLNSKITPKQLTFFSSTPLSFPIQRPKLSSPPTLYSFSRSRLKNVNFATSEVPIWGNKQKQEEEKKIESFEEFEYLAEDGEVYQKTLRLVECAMLSAVSGLVYILSNSLTLENYFGFFFALPIVLSSVKWGISAGRKTMVSTSVLLFVLSGPVKALTYALSYGLLGIAMGSTWRLKASWGVSILFCTLVRAIGALGSVSLTSLLIGENILALIIMNVHAGVTYLLTEMGIQAFPPMGAIYAIFGFVLILNCVFFVFLLHLFYAVFFTKFGMKAKLRLPKWVESAI